MAISKKLRFEVFKRDGFACGYCGKTPPEVTLEIDHINPKSKGGKDDINGLLTACFDCNRGKRDIVLKKIPGTLRDNLEILKEKEIQLTEYNKFIKKIERRIQREMVEVDDVFSSCFTDRVLSDNFKNVSLKRFFNSLPKNEIVSAMRLACDKISDDSSRAIAYFCGICWNKIKGKDR